MKYWLDAQLPPSLAVWLSEKFKVETIALRDLGLRDAMDTEIFEAARHSGIEIINIQPYGNKAKAYQVKQVRNIILKYKLAR